MSKMKIFIYFMFYISVATCFSLFFKWATVNPNDPWKNVLITLLLAAHVLYFIQLLPRKETITRFLTKIHAMGDNWVFVFCFIIPGSVAYELMMEHTDRIEIWFACSFLLALICFLVLHATPEVSCSICRHLRSQTFGMLVTALWEFDFLSAFAAGVPCFVCYLVMVTEFGGAA